MTTGDDEGPRRPRSGNESALPNALTLARLPLAALFWIAPDDPPFALTVLAVAGLTDLADGWVVRRRRAGRWKRRDPGAFAAGTGRGAWLDALCDKIFVVSVVTAVWVTVQPPAYESLLVVTRELLMAPLSVAFRLMPEDFRKEYDFTAGWPGKITTVLQFAAIGLAILRSEWLLPTAIAASASGAVAVAYYVHRAWRIGRS